MKKQLVFTPNSPWPGKVRWSRLGISAVKRLGWPRVKVIIDDLEQISAYGCGSCDFDEAEGQIVDHCKDCRFKITELVYELFHRTGYQDE